MNKEWYSINEMFGFIKKIFIAAMTFVGFGALVSSNLLKCISMTNQECKVRPAIVNINNNKPLFYSYSVLVNESSGSCNGVNNPYTKLCVAGVVKKMNIKVFYLLSKTNETGETCKCKCKLDESVCNDKQPWNCDKCRCECKELIDKGRYDDGFIWNQSVCECACDKSCDIGGYLDYCEL